MKASKILFSTDFSHVGDEALRFATQLAKESGAKLLIAHVEEPPMAYGGGDAYYGLPEPDTEAIKAMNAEECTCGCTLTIAECRINDPDCSISLPLARKLAEQIAARP